MAFGEIDLNLKPLNLQLFVTKPNRQIVGKLSESFNKQQTIKFGGVNELSLEIPYEIEINHTLQKNPNIDKVKQMYLIKAQLGSQIEWYVIYNIKDNGNDGDESKIISAYSLGYQLSYKKIRSYKVESYNATQVLTDALMYTNWSIDYIDPVFDALYRSFDVSSTSVLDFVFKIAETFNATIKWDTVNETISFYKQEDLSSYRGLKIKYGKYLQSIDKEEDSTEIVTRLKVFGKDGLSLYRVNPTGQSYIEDFSYFIYPFQRDTNGNVLSHSDYMSDSLCNAILDYNLLVESKTGEFDSLLAQKETLEVTLTTKENELTVLEDEMTIILDNLDVAKSHEQSTTTLEQDKINKQLEIDTKNAEINQVKADISNINTQIDTLRNSLLVENNFTSEQIVERNKFIIESDWVDQNYIDDKDLYEAAKDRFNEIKIPKTIIKIDIVNFLSVVEAQKDWDKLQIGDYITIYYEKFDINVQATIVEISYDYENDSINLTIANIKDIKDDEDKLVQMIYDSINTSTMVDMSKFKWNKVDDNESQIAQIINNTWDATKRQIQAGVNESVDISRRGILIKDSSDPNKFLIMQHGVLALTDDGGSTWKTAIKPEGVVAERIFGKLGAFAKLRADQIIVNNDSTETTLGSEIEGTVKQGVNYNNVTITSTEGVKASHSDGTYTQLSGDGLKRFVAGIGKEYFYLYEQNEITTIGSYSNTIVEQKTEAEILAIVPMVTITLPPDFHGKDFKIMAMAKYNFPNHDRLNNLFIIDSNYSVTYYQRNWVVDVVNVDKTNGTFQIKAYWYSALSYRNDSQYIYGERTKAGGLDVVYWVVA